MASEHAITNGILRCCIRLIAAKKGSANEQIDLMSIDGQEQMSELLTDLEQCCIHHPMWHKLQGGDGR